MNRQTLEVASNYRIFKQLALDSEHDRISRQNCLQASFVFIPHKKTNCAPAVLFLSNGNENFSLTSGKSVNF